jgi:ribosomal protein S18 acetylase RimI-like enzyme
MNVSIRPANMSDFDAVGRIFAQENRFHAELVPEIIQVLEPIMDEKWFADLLAGPEQILLLGELNGEVVGLVCLSERSNPDDPIYVPRRTIYVEELAVDERHRGRGIGRQLMAAAEAWARERGVREIELDVWEENRGAIAFYDRLNYRAVRRRMQRSLPDQTTTSDEV